MKKSSTPKIREFVLDGSVALAWCFPDEKAPYPESVLDSLAHACAIVPSLWHLEVANALLMGERRKRSTHEDTESWLFFLTALPVVVDDETVHRAWSQILNLARVHNLSVYDAAYLELAQRKDLSLATLDDKLKAAAKAMDIIEYVA